MQISSFSLSCFTPSAAWLRCTRTLLCGWCVSHPWRAHFSLVSPLSPLPFLHYALSCIFSYISSPAVSLHSLCSSLIPAFSTLCLLLYLFIPFQPYVLSSFLPILRLTTAFLQSALFHIFSASFFLSTVLHFLFSPPLPLLHLTFSFLHTALSWIFSLLSSPAFLHSFFLFCTLSHPISFLLFSPSSPAFSLLSLSSTLQSHYYLFYTLPYPLSSVPSPVLHSLSTPSPCLFSLTITYSTPCLILYLVLLQPCTISSLPLLCRRRPSQAHPRRPACTVS